MTYTSGTLVPSRTTCAAPGSAAGLSVAVCILANSPVSEPFASLSTVLVTLTVCMPSLACACSVLSDSEAALGGS